LNVIPFKNKSPAMAGCHLDRRFPVQHLKAELMICVGVFWHFQLLAEGLLLVGAVETE